MPPSDWRVTCPQRIRADTRQDRNRERELNPEQREKRRLWCVGKVCSCGCGRDANTAHHPRGELYETDALYFNLDNCEPYYHICHQKKHEGYVPCEICGTLVKPGYTVCWNCISDDKKREIEANKVKWKRIRKEMSKRMSTTKCNFCNNPATGTYHQDAKPKKKLKAMEVPVCAEHENESGGAIITPLRKSEPLKEEPAPKAPTPEKKPPVAPFNAKMNAQKEFVRDCPAKPPKEKKPLPGCEHRWLNFGGANGMKDGVPTAAWVCNKCGARKDLPIGQRP